MGPDLTRSSPGTIGPGDYQICILNGQMLSTHLLWSFIEETAKKIEEKRPKKKSKLSGVNSTTSSSNASNKPDDGPSGFKMRLVRRDKGCVVCHSPYTYSDDWSYFHGAHIFPFAMQGLWSTLKLSDDIRDPYTAASANNQICSKHDPLRINSLENGLLFCLFHHKAYHNFRFTIHPVSHKIFAFHPAMAAFDGQDVVAPWCNPNSANYPPPSAKLLRIHFEAAISVSCRVAAEVAEDDSDDSDDESDVSDRVRFWVEDSWQGEEYLDPQTVAGYEGAPPVGTG